MSKVQPVGLFRIYAESRADAALKTKEPVAKRELIPKQPEPPVGLPRFLHNQAAPQPVAQASAPPAAAGRKLR